MALPAELKSSRKLIRNTNGKFIGLKEPGKSHSCYPLLMDGILPSLRSFP
jgi:hypothetical protein